jgi:uncharacterized protein (DUF2336 family)
MAEAGSSERGKGDAARLLLAAARERFAVAATDLLLPERARLTEWQRLTAASLLSRLLRSVEDALRVALADHFAAHEAAAAALSSAHVPIALPILERAGALADHELGTILIRRVEEHRFWKAAGQEGVEDLLFAFVRDADETLAADAMEMVIARSRRFDRFQEPVLGHVDLPAELQHKLVWLVAAALRHYLVQHHGLRAVDEPIERAASDFIAGHDEGTSLEAVAARIARRLAATARLDGPLLARALGEGLLPLFIVGLGVLASVDQVAAWEILSDPRGRGPALMLKAAGVPREDAAAILLLLAGRGRLFSGAEGDQAAEQLDLFDGLDEASAREVLRLWQADPAYRASVARLSTRARPAAEAA